MIDEPTPDAPADSTPEPHSWIDRQFANTSILIVVVAACFCQPLMLIFAIIGLCLCKTPKAKRNALIITVLSAVLMTAYLVLGIVSALSNANP